MDRSVLRSVNLFSDLTDSEIDKISSLSLKRKYNRGEIIFFDTEPYAGFYVVVCGCVKIFKISKDGRENILHFAKPETTFAEVPLFEQYEKIRNDEFSYPANAMAIEDDTELILVRSKAFYELITTNKQICIKMLGTLSKRLRSLNKVFENRMKEIPQRLAEFLVMHIKEIPKGNHHDIEIDISKHDLAAYLGTIDETLSRAFKKLQEQGMIEIKGKMITVKDLRSLNSFASK